jgi:hypothetical protein
LVLTFTAGAFEIAEAKTEWTPEFNSYYGTFGTENDTFMGSCITCHINPDGKGGLDPYGTDLKIAGIKNNRPVSFAATEPLDSDGDGFDNLTEILVDAFPGDPNDFPGGANDPPVADAGTNQNVNEGDLVTLNGSGSTDPDDGIAAYYWEQIGGTSVSLSNYAAIQPTFTTPDVGPAGEALTFRLIVTDYGNLQASDTCIVNVFSIDWENQPPTADAGLDQTGTFSVEEGSTVTLDGSGSTDPDDGIVSYLWEQTGTGAAVTLSDPATIQPTFVTPVIDAGEVTLTFQLTVTDSGGLQAGDVVSVSIYDNGIAGFPAGGITVMAANNTPVGITEDGGGKITRLDIIDPATLPGYTGTPEDLMLGLIDLQVKTGTPGATATFTIYLSQPAPSGYKWYKYNSATNDWTDYGATTTLAGVKGAVFNTARDQVTLTLVDGDVGDDDGVANGTIEDPSSLGASIGSIDVIGTNNFGPAGGCFIAAAAHSHPDIPSTGLVIIWSLLLISFAVAVWYRKAKPQAG